MAYRNKTFVSFASEDFRSYNLMKAWRSHDHIEFNFFDAHDLRQVRNTSTPETIKRAMRERLKNTREVVLLVGDKTRGVAADSSRILPYELQVVEELQLPLIYAHLNGSRGTESGRVPASLAGRYAISVPFAPKVVRYALDNFPDDYRANLRTGAKQGPHRYLASVYEGLGL